MRTQAKAGISVRTQAKAGISIRTRAKAGISVRTQANCLISKAQGSDTNFSKNPYLFRQPYKAQDAQSFGDIALAYCVTERHKKSAWKNHAQNNQYLQK